MNNILNENGQISVYKKMISLPKEWAVINLERVGKFLRGKGITKKELSETGIACIRYGEIYTIHDFFIKSFDSYIDEKIAKTSQRIYKGDILFAGSGETQEEIGKSVAYLKDELAYAGGDIIILRPNIKVDSAYLGYALNNETFNKQKRKLGQGNSVVHIYGDELKKINIPVPPIEEQQKIAEILTTWDKAIELKEKLVEEKKKKKNGLMQRLLTGNVRLKGFEGEWKKVKLGNICDIKTGKLNANAMEKNGKYRFYTCAKEYYQINNYVFDTEALLISGNGANVGYIHYYNGKFNAYQRTYVLDKFKNNIKFVKYVLEENLSERIRSEKNVGNTPYIVLKALSDMMIYLPIVEEQEAIANILSIADKEIELLTEELEALKVQKKGLMQLLLTGIVRVNNDNKQ